MDQFNALIHQLSQHRSRLRLGYDLADLQHVVDQLIGRPLFKTIQVAGTNGKGSVATGIATLLSKEGYQAGLFTSPHLFSPLERISINGIPIAQEEVCLLYDQIKAHFAQNHFSFFDTFFLIALLYFKHQQVDFVVLEAGIGARLDATVLVHPILSVLTTVGLDHLDILGPTRDDVAREKSMAIRARVPVVLGAKAVATPILERAFQQNAPIYFSVGHDDYLIENAQTIATAVWALKIHYAIPISLPELFQIQRPPFRFQEIQHGSIKVIFDVAHNEEGMQSLLKKINHPAEFVLGFSSERNVDAILELFKASLHRIYLVHNKERGLIEKSEHFQNHSPMSIQEGMQQAFKSAKQNETTVCICGSFYLMEAALHTLALL